MNVELLVREADAACKGELTFQAESFLGRQGQGGRAAGPKKCQEALVIFGDFIGFEWFLNVFNGNLYLRMCTWILWDSR